MNAVLAYHSLNPHGIEAYKYFVGNGIEQLVRRALPDDRADTETVGRCVVELREEYGRRWACKTKLYDGIPELLDSLAGNAIKTAILSNKPDAFTRLAVHHFLSDWHFELIAGALPGVPNKPDPTGALRIAEKLRISPDKFLYLGDSDVDMKTALAAGMFPVGAAWGFRPAAELAANGARIVIDRPEDLLDLL